LIWVSYGSHISPMAKTPIPPEQETRQLNIKLAPEDSEYIQETLRQHLGLPYNAEAVREVIAHLRTWFRLPGAVVRLLKEDAETRHLNILEYLQMVLHQRYEELTDESIGSDSLAPGKGEKPQKGGAR
jgi:hypothetical protein